MYINEIDHNTLETMIDLLNILRESMAESDPNNILLDLLGSSLAYVQHGQPLKIFPTQTHAPPIVIAMHIMLYVNNEHERFMVNIDYLSDDEWDRIRSLFVRDYEILADPDRNGWFVFIKRD